MANDIVGITLNFTGANVYGIINDRERKVADIVTASEPLVTFVNANRDRYDLVFPETPASSRRYQATFPSFLSAGPFVIELFQRSGGSPAVGDTFVAAIVVDWTGTALFDTVSERNQIANAYLDLVDAIETGVTPRGAMRVNLAAVAGKSRGHDNNLPIYRDAGPSGDTKDRIIAATGTDGRSTVTIDTS